MPDFFRMGFAGVGCGRSFHGYAAITQTADVTVDFTHDVQLHPSADTTAVGAHEQTVLYQAAKFRALFADDTEDLMFKEKIHIGGILHIRGNSDMFHLLTV